MVHAIQTLMKAQEMAWHNVLCYSKNYLMSEPREGFEKEWKEAKQEALLIDNDLDVLTRDFK